MQAEGPATDQTATQPREYFPPRMKTGRAARYAGVSRRYLAQLAAAGRVPFYRLGPRCVLFARSDLDAFLADHRIDPAAVAGGALSGATRSPSTPRTSLNVGTMGSALTSRQ